MTEFPGALDYCTPDCGPDCDCCWASADVAYALDELEEVGADA